MLFRSAYGKTLLDICETTDLRILNGCVPGSNSGNFTCHITKGSSVVDYFLTSPGLTKSVRKMSVEAKCAESDHCPLTLEISLQEPHAIKLDCGTRASSPSTTVQKIKYDASKIELYRESLSSHLQSSFMESDPHCCLASALQFCISQAALHTFGCPGKKRLQQPQQKWYDAECKNARAALRHTDDVIEYAAQAKAYKQLLRRKRRAWQRLSQQNFCELASRNPQAFWRSYNERQAHKCEIPLQQWKTSFEDLYKAPVSSSGSSQTSSAPNPVNPPQSPDLPSASLHTDTTASSLLNADITAQEVQDALKRLKRNKAAGVDGIKAEYILDAQDMLLIPLVKAFNQILNKGVPPSWCIGLIHPIFKAGDPNDPGNYRGITVIVILAKLYAMVLETRATAWAEHMKCRAKGQAGFRKDFRTVDQIFIIQTLVQQARKSKRKLYCCFVDFRKAFDLVPRQTLWNILEQRGMAGKVLSSLKTMYAADKACVLTRDGPTDLFNCSIGVKQGCPASPLLFGLYLDELEALLEKAADEIDCPRLMDIILAILLFADDIALCSYSHAGLQKQLDILADFCGARGLTVNVKKTKTLVFETRASATPPLMYAGNCIEQVDVFKYLGVMLHATKGLSPAIEYLCKAAKRAMFGLQRRCQQLHIHDPVLKCKLFDTLVKPILCYCCEVWSIHACKSALESLERIEVGFLKALLGVQVHTKTLHVLAEFGRYPLHLVWHKQAANYLMRLESMATDRTLKQAFLADCRLPDSVSWRARLHHQLGDFLVPVPSEDSPDLQNFAIQQAREAHSSQLQSDTSSKTLVYKDIKSDYFSEP